MKKSLLLALTVIGLCSYSQAQNTLVYHASTTGAACQQVEYYDGFLYTGLGTTLRIYDVSGAATVPYDSVFEYHYRSLIEDLKINNGFLYVAANHDGISKWDISDPTAPQMVAEYFPDSIWEAAHDIAFLGDTLFVAYATKVAVFRDQGASFQKLDEFGYTGGNGNGIISGGALKDSLYAYTVGLSGLNNADGVYIYNAQTITSLAFYPQTFASPEDLLFGKNTEMIHVMGGTQSVYNPLNPHGYFYSLDITDPANPELAFNDTIKGFIGLAIANVTNAVNVNDTIYVASTAGLSAGQVLPDTLWIFVYDATDPLNISLLEHLPAGLWHFDVCVNRETAYIASEWYGVKTLNITDFLNPIDEGNTETGGWNVSADVHGNTLLVANEGYGFKKYDITNPNNPVLTGVNQAGTFCHHVKFSGDGNYIFAFYSTSIGMITFDSGTLIPVDSITTPGLANGAVALWDERLYTAFKPLVGQQVLNIFDVSDPNTVSLVSTFPMDINDMEIADGKLYISNQDSLMVYDVVSSDLEWLASIAVDIFGDAKELAVYKDTVFTYVSGLGLNKVAKYIFNDAIDSISLDGFYSLGLDKPEPQAMAADSFGLYIAYALHGLYAYDKATVTTNGYYRTGLDHKEYTSIFGVEQLFCKDEFIYLVDYFAQTSILSHGDIIVGIELPERATNQENLAVYPNPMTNTARIEFDYFANENYSLSIYDIQGRKIRTIPGIETGSVEIGRNNLGRGIYIFQLTWNRFIVGTGKLIIE